MPPFEAPLARAEFQNVRTTAYTHTEADHLAYGNHNALGGILHAAGSPLSSGTMVAVTGPLPPDVDDTAEAIGGVRQVANESPGMARPVGTLHPLTTRPAHGTANGVAAAAPDSSRAAPMVSPSGVVRHPGTVRPVTNSPASATSSAPADNPPWMAEYLRRKEQQRQQPSTGSQATFYITPAVAAPSTSPVVYGSAAADWSRWPVGTVFRIQSTGQVYQVDDYGWALAGRNTIDLYHATTADMNAWGVRQEPIQILRWGSREESLRLLRNHQGYRHIRRMVLELEGHERAAAELE